MKKEPYAVIRPINYSHTSGAATLPGVYEDPKTKESQFILANGLVVNILNPKLKQKENNLRFNSASMQENIFDEGEQKHLSRVAYYKAHPLVNIFGEKKKPNAKFEIEVLSVTKAGNISEAKSILKAQAYVQALSFDKQKDIMYFFGLSPRDMSEDDLWLKLCSPTNGLLLNKDQREFLLETHVDATAKDHVKNVEIGIFIEKGVDAGYLTKKGGKLYLDSRFIASKKEDQIAYFVDNKEEYLNMKKVLQEKGFIKKPELYVSTAEKKRLKEEAAKEAVKKAVAG